MPARWHAFSSLLIVLAADFWRFAASSRIFRDMATRCALVGGRSSHVLREAVSYRRKATSSLFIYSPPQSGVHTEETVRWRTQLCAASDRIFLQEGWQSV